MESWLCPKCDCDGRWLEYVSRGADVNYYRCECGHVWTISKDGRRREREVTVVAESSEPIEQSTSSRSLVPHWS
jgi:uncharacterized Zn finger protein